MASEAMEDLGHIHQWQEHQEVRVLQCVQCEAWRLQTVGAWTAGCEQQLAQARGMLDQLAWYLSRTTQLLQAHALTAEEAQQCQENHAFLLALHASGGQPLGAERYPPDAFPKE